MNVGLLYTPVSIYQMTRGALVLFVGLFSVVFLRQTLSQTKWLALAIVVTGVFVVGLSGIVYPSAPAQADADQSLDALRVAFGIFLIAIAQIFTAFQFVLEEHLLSVYVLPSLAVVGWEGVFGLSLTVLGMAVFSPFAATGGAGTGGYFDLRAGFGQMFGHTAVLVTSVLIMFSIGAFNVFGIAVTRSISAAARSTIDTCRTLGIWVVSVALGWERFHLLQVVGFAILVYGTLVFNSVIGLNGKRL
ncbi:uncharacterized protein V1510DRAFT_418884 [Dipodascopsis tothii]|uniref:uncharacterized protein n=1 Tax=Dipodascopsis tothii TaxID=44089 RepID=UPI0034CE9F03